MCSLLWQESKKAFCHVPKIPSHTMHGYSTQHAVLEVFLGGGESICRWKKDKKDTAGTLSSPVLHIFGGVMEGIGLTFTSLWGSGIR